MKTKLTLLTLALSSTLMLTACNDDDNDDFNPTYHSDDVNHAPSLVVEVKPIAADEVAKGIVILESEGTDEDEDTLTYALVNDTEGYYAIDANKGAVSLTEAGVEAVKADKALPKVNVSISDGNQTVTKSATPSITTSTTPPNVSDDPTLTEFLADDDKFATLSQALTAAPGDNGMNLGQDIEKLDNITFLAPTNDAIEKTLDILAVQMPELDTSNNGKVEIEELTANTELLKSMLQYHVVTNEIDAADVSNNLNNNLSTLNELPLVLTKNGSNFEIPSQIIQLANAATGATQIAQAKIDLQDTDNDIANGVVHVIDQALIPPMYNIDETLVKLPETEKLREFMALITNNDGSVSSVAGTDANSYTVLAPNNKAANAKCVEFNQQVDAMLGASIVDENDECDLAPLAGYADIIPSYIPIANNIKTGTLFEAELGVIKGDIIESNIIATDGVVHITNALQE